MHVRNDEWPYREFMERIDALRIQKGIRTDAELGKLGGVHPTMIGKWRSGQTKPSIESLRGVAHALGQVPVVLWLWAGVVTPEDFDTPAVYMEARNLDAELPEDEREIMRTHLGFLLEGTRARLASRQDGPSNIRRKTTRE